MLEPGDHLVRGTAYGVLADDLWRVRGIHREFVLGESLDQALGHRLLILEPCGEVVVVDADLACRLLDVCLIGADVGSVGPRRVGCTGVPELSTMPVAPELQYEAG